MLSEREDIAIAEVAVYLPLLCLAVYVCVRHGFIKQLGWLYLVIFCTLRIASGIMGIIYAKHPNSITDAIWAAVLGSVGLSPLFLVGIDLLERGYVVWVGKSRPRAHRMIATSFSVTRKRWSLPFVSSTYPSSWA